MKIGGLYPFTLSDYPGCCAAIIFTIGCNFRCPYCHNKKLLARTAKQISIEQIFGFLKAKQGRLDGVVISGGEPTIQQDLYPFIRQIKNLDYKVKLDTNGTNPIMLKKLLDDNLVDYVAMDIKAPFPLYHQLAGAKVAIADIEKSIAVITNSRVRYLFRTTWDKNLLTQDNLNTIEDYLPKNSNFIIQDCV